MSCIINVIDVSELNGKYVSLTQALNINLYVIIGLVYTAVHLIFQSRQIFFPSCRLNDQLVLSATLAQAKFITVTLGVPTLGPGAHRCLPHPHIRLIMCPFRYRKLVLL